MVNRKRGREEGGMGGGGWGDGGWRMGKRGEGERGEWVVLVSLEPFKTFIWTHKIIKCMKTLLVTLKSLKTLIGAH